MRSAGVFRPERLAGAGPAFAMTGIGTSVIFPLAMSAAAQLTDRPAPTNVASLAQIAFVAFLLGPPLLGYIAEYFWHSMVVSHRATAGHPEHDNTANP